MTVWGRGIGSVAGRRVWPSGIHGRREGPVPAARSATDTGCAPGAHEERTDGDRRSWRERGEQPRRAVARRHPKPALRPGAARADGSAQSNDRREDTAGGGRDAGGTQAARGAALMSRPRPGRPRFRRLFAVLALALAPLLIAAPEARAELLIGNLGIGTASANYVSTLDANEDVAQAFTTGGNAGGYTLESVSLFFDDSIGAGDIGDLEVTIRSDASGDPGTTLWTLTNPASVPKADYPDPSAADAAVFTAPDGTVLEADTTYFVVVGYDQFAGVLGLGEHGEESGGADGWSIANGSKWLQGTTWVDDIGDDPYIIRVNGEAKDAASTDATLSALSLGTGVALDPTFAGATTDYRAWVPNGTSSVTATATKNDDGATVAIAGDTDTGTPGTASISLDPGRNTVTVTVTAEDGATTVTYTVVVVREAAAPTADPAALLTANVTVGDTSGLLGYYGVLTTGRGAITDDDFEFDGETYELDAVVLTGDTGLGNFSAEQAIACFGDNEPSEAVRNRLGLRIGAHSFKLADASAVSGLVCFEWARPSGLAWAWGDIALVKMTEVGPNSAATGAPAITGTANVPSDAVSAETPDIVAPAPVSASVPAAGTSVAITFDEALDDTASRLPQAARFAVTTAAGDEIRLDGVAVSGTTVTLSLHADSPVIRTGQTVTVAYTDRTSGDDAGGVVQDDAGNDAASFATGAGGVAAVVNGSTVAVGNPGAPRNLAARPAGADSIRVTWDPPADTGGRAITFYWLQASTDGTTFADLAEIDATDPNTGRVATEYTHTGLQIGDARHYRVRAHNDALALSPYSGVVMGRALEPEGRVDVAFDPAGVSEGGTATVLVTATTVANAQPASGFELTVALATEDGTATAPGDYAALDETVRFGRGDFSRRTVDGASRWVAEKRATVTIVDDVEAENAETFAATARVTNIETSRFVAETGRAEATIAASDPWAVSVTAAPSSVTEGESVSVALTARIVRGDGTAPGSGECLVPFAVDVGLAVSGTATGDGADYTLSGTTAAQEIAACSTAGVSWTVELAALVDAEDDGGETVAFAPEIAGTPAVAPAEGTAGTVFLRELKSVLLDRIALGVDEGGSAGYTARLTSRPTGTVTLTPQVSGDMDVTVAPSVLTFTGSNWNLPQTLTVHAAQDADDEDDTASVRPSAWPTRAGSMPARSAGSTAGTIAPTKPRQVSMPASCTGLTCSTGRDPVPGRLAAEWHPDGPVRARVRRLARRAATPGRKACE